MNKHRQERIVSQKIFVHLIVRRNQVDDELDDEHRQIDLDFVLEKQNNHRHKYVSYTVLVCAEKDCC